MPVYTYTTIDDPLNTQGSIANGINASGQIVGSYTNNSGDHGFLLSGGTYTTLDDPLNTQSSVANGINTSGRIVGATGTAAASAATSTAAVFMRPLIWPLGSPLPRASTTWARSSDTQT
jgi:probable HAF family extracellular repeat protein